LSVDIENLGDVEGTYTALLTVDARPVDTQDILVKPRAVEKAAFTCTLDSPGTHVFQLGYYSRIVTVFKPAEFSVIDMSLDQPEIAAGASATVTGKIANIGEVSGVYTAVLTIDGTTVESKDVIVGPGATGEVTFGVNKNTPGSYQIALGPQTRTLSVFKSKAFLLKHDNHVISDSWSAYDPRGQWVRFSPPARPFVIQKVYVGGKRTDFSQPEKKNYILKIWNKDFTQMLYSAEYPYSKFSTSLSMVEHEIKPELYIEDDFYVEIISHSENPPLGENNSRIAIYIECDFTVKDNENSGYSWLGTIDTFYKATQIARQPKFAAFSWIIQVGGIGKALPSATATLSEKVVIDPELQSLVSDARAALSKAKRYKYDLDMQMPFEISSGIENARGTITATGKGYLDKADKEMTLIMKMNIDLLGKKIENTSEKYITRGWVYEKLRSDRKWENRELTDEEWNSIIANSILEGDYQGSPSSIELTGREIVDGIDCQVLEIKLDKNKFFEILASDQNVGSFLKTKNLDSFDIQEFTIREWIAKDTHLPAKEELRFSFEASVKDTAENAGGLEQMNMELHYTVRLYDYNVPVKISLPPAALKGLD
jgi:hypothetical protein